MEIYRHFPKRTLRNRLCDIYNLIQNPKYKEINSSYDIEQSYIESLFTQAIERLDNIPNSMVRVRQDVDANKILVDWKNFDASFNGELTNEVRTQYEGIIKPILSLLEYIRTYQQSTRRQQRSPVRTIDIEREKARLETIKVSRVKVKEEIDRLKNMTPAPEEQIKQYEKWLDNLNKTYMEVQKTISDVNSDKTSEENIQQRITDAFEDLSKYTQNIEEERDRIKNEFWFFFYSIPVLAVLFLIAYIVFLIYYMSNSIYFYDWQSYLPFSILIPIIATLLWICIYQKNRANKISIELSSRLFNIHYLEGLIKMTNTLSKNSDVSLDRISNTIDIMLNSYQKQMAGNQLSGVEISQIEKKELESNPYWKMMQELKELIKSRKDDK